MSEQNVKQQIIQAIETLPDDATNDDAVERIIFLSKIETAIAQADAGMGIPHEEVKKRMAKWLS